MTVREELLDHSGSQYTIEEHRSTGAGWSSYGRSFTDIVADAVTPIVFCLSPGFLLHFSR